MELIISYNLIVCSDDNLSYQCGALCGSRAKAIKVKIHDKNVDCASILAIERRYWNRPKEHRLLHLFITSTAIVCLVCH